MASTARILRIAALAAVAAAFLASDLQAAGKKKPLGWSFAPNQQKKTSKQGDSWFDSIGSSTKKMWTSTTRVATSWWPKPKTNAAKPTRGWSVSWPKLPGTNQKKQVKQPPDREPRQVTGWLAQERPGF